MKKISKAVLFLILIFSINKAQSFPVDGNRLAARVFSNVLVISTSKIIAHFKPEFKDWLYSKNICTLTFLAYTLYESNLLPRKYFLGELAFSNLSPYFIDSLKEEHKKLLIGRFTPNNAFKVLTLFNLLGTMIITINNPELI